MNERMNSCFLVGLPESGKSTFIAALWHVVETGEVNGAIKIESLPEDREYLNDIRQKWLDCIRFDRNKVGFFKPITLSYRNSMSSILSDFVIPDTSGELYQMQFEDRKLNVEYISMVKSANGVMLFVDPDKLKKPVLISDALVGLGDLGIESESQGKEWKHNDVSTQVILVDLLQMITPYLEKPVKLVIVISAWDLIRNSTDIKLKTQKPVEWLQNQLPLLYQFINSEKVWSDHLILGISAQGAKYNGNNDTLHSFEKPSERIIVQEGCELSNDITIPMKWLINERN